MPKTAKQPQILKRYVLRKEGNVPLLIFLALWLAGAAAMAGIMLFALTTEPVRHSEFWLAPLALVSVFTFGLRIWLWHWQGKEVLTAYSTHVEIAYLGSFLYRTLSVPVSELDNISTASPKETPHWLRWWGFSGGSIRIEYLGRSVLIGQDLPQKRAGSIVQQLNDLYWSRS